MAAKHRRATTPAATCCCSACLKGALHVLSDLARVRSNAQPAARAVSFWTVIAVSSYGNAHRSSGEVRLGQRHHPRIEGRHVVVVEDIVDNGLTPAVPAGNCSAARRPATLTAAVLLDKPFRRRRRRPAGIRRACRAPDEFIVGYGLDYQERYRTLP